LLNASTEQYPHSVSRNPEATMIRDDRSLADGGYPKGGEVSRIYPK
jgi:hypothetical protein